MNFLQEKTISVSKQFEFGNSHTSEIEHEFLISISTLYYIVPILCLIIIFFSIKRFKPLNSFQCPSCDRDLLRVKRKKADYILNFFVLYLIKIRRYKCKSCKWEGLRIKYH